MLSILSVKFCLKTFFILHFLSSILLKGGILEVRIVFLVVKIQNRGWFKVDSPGFQDPWMLNQKPDKIGMNVIRRQPLINFSWNSTINKQHSKTS